MHAASNDASQAPSIKMHCAPKKGGIVPDQLRLHKLHVPQCEQ